MNPCMWKKLSLCSDLAALHRSLQDWLSARAAAHYPSTGNILFSCRTTARLRLWKMPFLMVYKHEFALRQHRICWAPQVRALRWRWIQHLQLFGVGLSLCPLWAVQENLSVFRSFSCHPAKNSHLGSRAINWTCGWQAEASLNVVIQKKNPYKLLKVKKENSINIFVWFFNTAFGIWTRQLLHVLWPSYQRKAKKFTVLT